MYYFIYTIAFRVHLFVVSIDEISVFPGAVYYTLYVEIIHKGVLKE